MTDTLAPLLLGVLFGVSLQRAGLTQYARIVGVYRLRDLTVLRFMLTALAIGALAAQLGLAIAPGTVLPVPPTRVLAQLTGGAIFGVGMALAGYCPGTIAAELGEGRLDALTAGLAGLFTGALAFDALGPSIMPTLARAGSLGHVSIATLVDASPSLVAWVFAQLVLLVLLRLARVRDREPEPDAATPPRADEAP